MQASKSTFLYGTLSLLIVFFVLTVDISRAFAYVKQQVVTSNEKNKINLKDIWRPYGGRRQSPLARLKSMLRIGDPTWVAAGFVEETLISYKGRQYVSGSACVKGGKGTPRVQLLSKDKFGQDHSIGVFEAKVDKDRSGDCNGGAFVYFSILAERSWQSFNGQSIYAYLVFSDGEKFQHFLLRNSGELVLKLKDSYRQPAAVAYQVQSPGVLNSMALEKTKKVSKKSKRLVASHQGDEESVSNGKGQKLSLKGLSKVEKRAIKRFLREDPNIQFLDISEK